MDEQHPDALHRLVTGCAPVVWQACAALAGADAAERLAVETFRRLWSAQDATEVPTSVLLSAARAVCAADRVGTRQRSGSPHTGDNAAATMTRQWIISVLEEESPTTREVFLLTALAGFSYVDVATACGCSLRVVRDQVDAARRRIFVALEEGNGRIHNAGGW